MRMRLTVAAALLGLATIAIAQEQPTQTFNESVSVGYVMVPFTVLDRHGAPITNLKQRDISLYVEGLRVRTDMFEESMNAPVSWTILLDASGSMALAGKMDAARAAVSTLLNHKRPGDDFALFMFAESEATVLVPATDDGDKIRRAMFDVKPYGKTAFFDALATMPERTELGKNPTRAIVLLSDGIDNASRHNRASLAQIFEGSSIPIYPLGLRDPAELKPHQVVPYEELSDLDLLDAVANLTGGKLYLGRSSAQLASGVEAMQKDLRAQYLVGFTPTGKGEVKYRRIALQLAGRARVVRVRAGYRGTEPPALTSSASRGKSKNEKKGSSR
jgi:Ca-activated chloride channel family protein